MRQEQLEEETTKAKALFRLFRRKLNNAGYETLADEEIIREGKKGEEILKLIDEDEDIAVLVLGASAEAAGPGPLVSSLAAGARPASFRSQSPSCPATWPWRKSGAGLKRAGSGSRNPPPAIAYL